MQFRKLITPVIVVICVSLFVLGFSASFFANQQDRGAVVMEQRVFDAILNEHMGSMVALAEDNAWWDKAVENMYLTENIAWLEESYGGAEYGIAETGFTLVVRPDMTLMFEGIYRGLTISGEDVLTPSVRQALTKLEASGQRSAISDSGLVIIGDKIFAVGLSMVQPGNIVFDDPLMSFAPKPVIIFGREVETPYLMERMSITGVENLSFSQVSTGNHQYEVLGIGGDMLGYYSWSPDQPGSRLLTQMFWPGIVFAIVIIVALARFIVQARRAIEGAENADKAKNMFLASMSHEVRTPLNAILGFSEMIALELFGKVEGEKNQEYLQIIRRSGEHLLSVINDILDISKLEAGRFDVHTEILQPKAVVEECMEMVQGIADENKVALVSDVEDVSFECDARIMRQCLINILSNAIKFSPSGSRVFVSGQTVHGFYCITIADNGGGMQPDEVEVALQPFGQVRTSHLEATKTVGQKGTGLGLPLVKRFMDLIGGSMKLRSVPNHGTSVSLSFPLDGTRA